MLKVKNSVDRWSADPRSEPPRGGIGKDPGNEDGWSLDNQTWQTIKLGRQTLEAFCCGQFPYWEITDRLLSQLASAVTTKIYTSEALLVCDYSSWLGCSLFNCIYKNPIIIRSRAISYVTLSLSDQETSEHTSALNWGNYFMFDLNVTSDWPELLDLIDHLLVCSSPRAICGRFMCLGITNHFIVDIFR